VAAITGLTEHPLPSKPSTPLTPSVVQTVEGFPSTSKHEMMALSPCFCTEQPPAVDPEGSGSNPQPLKVAEQQSETKNMKRKTCLFMRTPCSQAVCLQILVYEIE